MVHLYMHLRHGDEYIQDLEGADFENLDVAHAEAVASAREIMSERLRLGQPMNGSRFELADERGKIVLLVPFRAAMTD